MLQPIKLILNIQSYSRYAKLKYYKLHLMKFKFYHLFRVISDYIWLKVPKISKKKAKKRVPQFLAGVHKD